MGSYKLFFDLLHPQFVKVFEYSGPTPSRIFKHVKSIIVDTLAIEGPSFYEDSIKWDVAGDPVMFYGVWRGVETKDARAKIVLQIKIQGEEGKRDRQGWLTVWIRYMLNVDIPYGNFLEKSLSFINAELYYKPRVRQYQEQARRRMDEIEDKLRSTFDLIRKTKP